MTQMNENMFYVIELVDFHPFIKFHKYVCIPSCWIMLREISDDAAIVKFPTEKWSITKKRVKKQETYLRDWMIFNANIKYCTDSYKDAKEYIKLLKKITIQEKGYTENTEKDLTSTPDEEQKSQSDSEDDELMESLTVTQDGPIPAVVNSQNEQYLLNNNNKQLQEIESSDQERNKYFTRYSAQHSSLAAKVNLMEQAVPKMVIMVKKLKNGFDESINADDNEKENMSSLNNIPKFQNQLQPSLILQTLFSSEFRQLLNDLYSECEKNKFMIEALYHAYSKHCMAIKTFLDMLDKFQNIINTSDVPAIKKIEENSGNRIDNKNKELNQKEVHGHKEKLDSRDAKEEGRNMNKKDKTDDNNTDHAPSKIERRDRSFTLPPEYDENDSKWTIRHRNKKKGLVELMPHSGVYINAMKLNNSKRHSNDTRSFARKLLPEIFTENALRTCSLTGKKACVFDPDGIHVRPGLDNHARMVLLDYVQKYSRKRNWIILDRQLLHTCLRNKIHNIRSKYNNTQVGNNCT
ncbi:uncharacterized protein LOC131844680 [Achroia grisella]|uniref:uncharacterized protein LOC131844680 n=1 Tax=Achroia grisella TaxID=688607 RepID=UPI0027D2D27F|nr:uncharacterized protein LOC131844680 [Achroia grisella]